MKYIRQFLIITAVSFLGEVLHSILPLPVPASIYGLVLMLLALCLHVIPLDSVRETGKFLVEVMPLMFIPAAVGLTQTWDRLSAILVELVVILIVSTIAVMVVSGIVTQAVMKSSSDQKRIRGQKNGRAK